MVSVAPERRVRLLVLLVGMVALGVVASVALLCLRTFAATRTARSWVDHTHQVAETIATLRISLLQGVVAVRTRLLTELPTARAQLEQAEAGVARDEVALTTLTQDNPTQQTRLAQLQRLLQERFAILHRQLEEPTPAAVADIQRGIALDREITPLLQAMQDHEQDLLHLRDETYEHTRSRTEHLVLVTVFLAVVAIVVALPVLLQQMRLRARAETSLVAANQTLEAQVAARTHELFESRERLALAMRIGGIGTYDWEMAQGRLVWSPELERMWGLAVGSFDGRYTTFQSLVLPEDLPGIEAAVQAAVASGGGIDREFRIRRPDGTVRWIRTIGQVLPGQRFLGVNIDTTAAREAHESILASERRYRFLAESMPEIVWTAYPDGRIDYVNHVYATFTGQPVADVQQREWGIGIHPDDHAAAVARWRGALADGEPFVSELRLRRADGVWRWQLVRAHPLRAPDGTILQWVGTCTDIEDQRRRAAELERQVQVRTRALRVANEELESFSYSVSHDLRAPLRAIEGFASALEEDHGGHLPPEGLHQLARVRAAASRMATIIDALLGLARTGRGTLQVKPVDCAALAASVLADLREHDPGRVVEATIEPCVLQADPDLMRTVFENLLGNAWKFTRGRNPTTIRVACAPAPPGWVSLVISDNGAGFDPTHAASMFQPFRRFHDPAQFPGSGIGLATVRRIVERHGGTIAAEGAPEQGAAFHITLPASPETT